MNTEFEVKNILRDRDTLKEKVDNILKMSNFNKELVIKAINIGGRYPYEIYGNLINMQKNLK